MALELVLSTITFFLWALCVFCSPQRARRALVDLIICAAIAAYQNKNMLLDSLSSRQLLAFGAAGLSCSLWIYINAVYAIQGWRALHHHQDGNTKLEPVFYKCKTAHRRFIPKKHTFTYSYLLVGFGISWEGNQGFLFSVNQNSRKKSPPWSLFSINSMDYLQRGQGSLWKKLQEFLHDNDEDILEYPTIYFVTAPRFVGSSFSQIDFWYLYDRIMNLKLVVVEVMNTFDERHAYLLRPDKAETSSSSHFIQVAPKKLHVSPFNDSTGRYKLISHDPLRGLEEASKVPGIDVTIILQTWDESKGRYVAKFMADLRSIEPPIHGDLIAQSLGSTINFAVRYGWIVLFDLPRVIYQAFILWAVKKMRVYHKPQVLGESVCRASTELERKLELSFRKYLTVQVQCSATPTIVSYVSAISGDSRPMVVTSEHQSSSSEGRVVHLKVLDPGFYVQWACMCRFPKQFLHKQLSEPDPLKRTIQISQRGAGFAEETFAQILNADSTHSGIYQEQANKHWILHQLLSVLWGVYENRTKYMFAAGDLGRLNTQWSSGLYIHQGFDVSPFDILNALLTQLIAFGDGNVLNAYGTLLQIAVYVGFWKSFRAAWS